VTKEKKKKVDSKSNPKYFIFSERKIEEKPLVLEHNIHKCIDIMSKKLGMFNNKIMQLGTQLFRMKK